MQLATGIVVDGKVVVEGESLPEGAVVTILVREADETFRVPRSLRPSLKNPSPKPIAERPFPLMS